MTPQKWRVQLGGNRYRRADPEFSDRAGSIARETSNAVSGVDSIVVGSSTPSSTSDQMARLQSVWSASQERRRKSRSRAQLADDRSEEFDDAQRLLLEPRREAIATILSQIRRDYDQERIASDQSQWCDQVPRDLKLETVQSYLRTMYDETTLPTESCAICLIQTPPKNIRKCRWQTQLSPILKQFLFAKTQCRSCFPTDQSDGYAEICDDCDGDIRNEKQPENCGGDLRFLTCSHLYPPELRGLTIAEERLISLNVPYGYITRYCRPTSAGTSWHYRQHKQGHISVYINDLDSLTATVLPHPLVKMMESIRVCWSGAQVPSAMDLSKLMSVRPRRIMRALRWKKFHDELYANVQIDENIMSTWDLDPETSVPTALWNHLEEIEDTLASNIRSAPITSGLDRPDQDEPREGDLESSIHEVVQDVIGVHNDSRSDQMDLDPPADFSGELDQPSLSSGLFPLDEDGVYNNADRLDFLYNAVDGQGPSSRGQGQPPGIGYEPFIDVGRSHQFANSFESNFWAKTFGLLFPNGLGGPISTKAVTPVDGVSLPIRNLTLRRWLSIVLRQEGGRFSTHPAFAFLAFDMLLRSMNRQISSARMHHANYDRLAELHAQVSGDQDRLERARAELKENGRTTDREVTAILRELSVYSENHPFSSEARRKSRGRIESLCVAAGLPAIWLTVNPNDLDHPVRITLSKKRLIDPGVLQLQNEIIASRWEHASHASSDPLSAAQFFHREMELFFEHYVRVGNPSIFGRVKHYIGLVETNERHSLHMHGLIWLYGAFDLPLITKTLQDPQEESFRAKVLAFLENLISQNLDYDTGRSHQKSYTLQEVNWIMINCREQLDAAFDNEANFSAYCRQLHMHTLTCVKHIPRDELRNRFEAGRSEQESERQRKRRRQELRASLCRFRFPKNLVPTSNVDEDGVVHLERNHRMINNYNQSMAVGLRHNHDINFIFTRTRAFALSRYIMYYATKSRLPITAGISAVLALQRRGGDQGNQSSVSISDNSGTGPEASRQFWMKLANRVSSEVEVSAVEVCSSLLDYPTEYCSVQDKNWSYLNLNIVFWTVFNRWSYLRSLAAVGGNQVNEGDHVAFTGTGRRLSIVEAYPHRGEVLAHLCLYEYARIIKIKKLRRGQIPSGSSQIPLESNSSLPSGFIQELRSGDELATVSMGNVGSLFSSSGSPSGINRSLILKLALFVPWQEFLCTDGEDPDQLWMDYRQDLSPVLQQVLTNIQSLEFSKEDADLDSRIRDEPIAEETEQVDITGGGCGNTNFDIESLDGNHGGLALAALAIGSMIRGAKDINILNLQKPSSAADQTLLDLQHFITKPGEFLAEKQIESEDLLDSEDFGFNISAGNFTPKKIKEIIDLQKAADQRIARSLASRELQGMDLGEHNNSEQGCGSGQNRYFGPDQRTEVTLGRSTSYREAGKRSSELWTLNQRQALALHLPLQFLDQQGYGRTTTAQKQLRLYIGGEGGTGKTQVLHALRDVFRMKSEEYAVEMTASSAIAASKIGGRTIHSAVGLQPDQHGRSGSKKGDGPSGEEIARWKHRLVLVIDEISMLGAATLADVDTRLQQLRSSKEAFGGIPIIIFSGDFFQFPPVKDRSVLLQPPQLERKEQVNVRIRQTRGFHLFNDCHKVVMLKQQVRASSCPQLRGILNRFRKGEQTEADHEQLCTRAHREVPWVLGSKDGKMLTPINQQRWDQNLASALEWGASNNRHISLFLSSHEWVDGIDNVSDSEIISIFQQGDSSQVKVPSLLPFGRGMPMILTHNTHSYLKLVNGAEVEAVHVVPDPKYPGYYISSGVTLYLGPPRALIIQSPAFDHLETTGLPPGMVAITPSTVQLNTGLQWITKKVRRTGYMITPAFAMTDMKGQGMTTDKVLAQLRGRRRRPDLDWAKCDFMSAYVQLSRATSWAGIWLATEPRREDFLENRIPADFAAGVRDLEAQSETTISAFLRANRTQEEQRWISWWQAIAETTSYEETAQNDQIQDHIQGSTTVEFQQDVEMSTTYASGSFSQSQQTTSASSFIRSLPAHNHDQGRNRVITGERPVRAQYGHFQRFHIQETRQNLQSTRASERRIRKHLWRQTAYNS